MDKFNEGYNSFCSASNLVLVVVLDVLDEVVLVEASLSRDLMIHTPVYSLPCVPPTITTFLSFLTSAGAALRMDADTIDDAMFVFTFVSTFAFVSTFVSLSVNDDLEDACFLVVLLLLLLLLLVLLLIVVDCRDFDLIFALVFEDVKVGSRANAKAEKEVPDDDDGDDGDDDDNELLAPKRLMNTGPAPNMDAIEIEAIEDSGCEEKVVLVFVFVE